MMTSTQVRFLATLLALVGGGILAYLLWQVPPRQSNGQLDLPALALFFGGLWMLTTGLVSLLADRLHRRWPALAGHLGVDPRFRTAGAALRQGALLALALCLVAAFAFLRILDIIFVLVILLLVGLVEAYFQSR
jgi:hypothetical protein